MLKEIITILSVLSFTTALAQSANTEQEFKQKLESVSSKNKTIKSEFTQVKKIKNIKQAVSSKGEFFYDSSGRISLIYSEPKGDKIIMEGDEFTIIIAGKKMLTQAKSNPIMTQISYMMRACMSADVTKLGSGWKLSIESTQKDYQVKLTPIDRRIQKYIIGIFMVFDKSDLTLNVLRIEETSGGYTEYSFTNKKINPVIDNIVFKAD